jgi:hypothetical protein
MSVQVVAAPNFLQSIVDRWKSWRRRRMQAAELEAIGSNELVLIAHDLGLSVPELRRLAEHGPGSADLLRERMTQLDLDPAEVDRVALRDLQRCCSECDAKGQCAHDLQDQPDSAKWREYCPNRETLDALSDQKALERLAQREKNRKPICAAWPA